MAMDPELLEMNRLQKSFDRLPPHAKKYLYDRLSGNLDTPKVESDTPIADSMEADCVE